VNIGYNKPLYILPYDHRSSFEKGLYGWSGALSPEQTDRIAKTKSVIYDAFKLALSKGLPKERAGILVDEQFGAAILGDAIRNGYITAMGRSRRVGRRSSNSNTEKGGRSTSRRSSPSSRRCWSATTRKMTRR
jgi:Uncharacterized protein conserved in bacteria (DUF2090)